jgi:hypothetical protein
MALQLGALRDALIEANVSPDKASKAAEEVALYDNRVNEIDGAINRVGDRMAHLDARLTERMGALEATLSERIRSLESRVAIMLTLQVTVLAAIAGMFYQLNSLAVTVATIAAH